MKRLVFAATGVLIGSVFGPTGALIGGIGGLLIGSSGSATKKCERCHLIAKGRNLEPTLQSLREEARKRNALYDAAIIKILAPNGASHQKEAKRYADKITAFYRKAEELKTCKICANWSAIIVGDP